MEYVVFFAVVFFVVTLFYSQNIRIKSLENQNVYLSGHIKNWVDMTSKSFEQTQASRHKVDQVCGVLQKKGYIKFDSNGNFID